MKIFPVVLLCSVLLFPAAIFSQQVPAPDPKKENLKEEKKEEKKEDPKIERLREREARKNSVKISGKIYASFTQEFKKAESSDKNNDLSSFAVDRAYLTVKKKLDKVFSIKITADAESVENTGTTTTTSAPPPHTHDVTTSSNPYNFYLKYAYIQAKPTFKSVFLQFRVGMIDTPIIGVTEKMSDYRWISQDLIQNSPAILGSTGLHDSAADLGFSARLDLGNKVDFVFAMTNGEGYRNAWGNPNSGSAWYGLISITPIEEIFINGYLRIENEEYTNSQVTPQTYKSNVYYFGCGLGFKSRLLKAGFNLLKGKRENKDPAPDTYNNINTSNNYFIFDSWLNVNFAPLIGTPILLVGRFVYGDDTYTSWKAAKLYGAGIGYEFNRHVRVLSYYEQYIYDSPLMRDSMKFYIKAEGRF